MKGGGEKWSTCGRTETKFAPNLPFLLKKCYNRRKIGKGGGIVGLFSRNKQQKINEARACALHGKIIRYVTERVNGEEIVLGRSGSTAVHDGQLIVLSSKEIVFRSRTKETSIAYLLSGDGVTLTAPNLARGGKLHTVTAFFVDHIK